MLLNVANITKNNNYTVICYNKLAKMPNYCNNPYSSLPPPAELATEKQQKSNRIRSLFVAKVLNILYPQALY